MAKVQVALACVSTWRPESKDGVVVTNRDRSRPAGDLEFGWLPHRLSAGTKITMSSCLAVVCGWVAPDSPSTDVKIPNIMQSLRRVLVWSLPRHSFNCPFHFLLCHILAPTTSYCNMGFVQR